MKKVIVTADSTCDLSEQLIKKYDIRIVPLGVSLGDRSGFDGVDITPDDIYDYVNQTGRLPKTHACSIDQYSKVFKSIRDEGYECVHVCISSGFSCTFQNACLAADEFEGVRVVDSLNLSTGSGHVVIEAAIKAQEGWSADEIYNFATALTPKVDASFVLDDLKYLVKGGRCSAAAALGANLLKLKPCIEVKEGKMGVGKKYRGAMQTTVRQYTRERLSQPGVKYKRDRVFVTHTKMDEGLTEAMIEEVKATGLFDEIIETTAGCTITSHCGPNTIGVLFIKE